MSDPIHALIREIYHAASTPEHWSDVTRAVTKSMSCDAAFIQWLDLRERQSKLLFTSCQSVSEPLKTYEAFYSPNNPCVSWALRRKPNLGALVSSDEVMDYHDFERTALYNDVFRPMDLHYYTVTHLSRTSDELVFFIALSSTQRGSLRPKDLELYRLMSNHLVQAVALQSEWARTARDCDIYRSVMDSFATPVLVTTADARIVTTNNMAEEVLRHRDPLFVCRQRLNAVHHDECVALHHAIFVCARTAAGRGHDSGKIIRLAGESLKTTLVRVMPFMFEATGGSQREGLALVKLLTPVEQVAPCTLHLRRAFGLTRREAEVAAMFYDDHNLGQVATKLGIGIETARTHFKRVMEKCEVTRQSELISVLQPFAHVRPPRKKCR